MAFGNLGSSGTGISSASASSFTLTTSNSSFNAASSRFGVLRVCVDNITTTDGATNDVISVTGGVGTWTKLGEYTNGNGGAAAGVTVALFLFMPSGNNAVGTVFTINLAGAVVDKTAQFHLYTHASGQSVRQAGSAVYDSVDATNGFGSCAISGLTSKEYLFGAALGKEANTTTAITVSSGFTTTLGTLRSRSNAAAVCLAGEFRILTGTGATSNPTLAVSGDAANVFTALEEYTPGGGTDDLDADDLSTGAPTIGAPAVGQIHSLGASALAAGAPVLGSPALAQIHALDASGLAASAPTIGQPSVGQVHQLAALSLEAGAPVFGTADFAQVHLFAADGIAAGAPVLDTPELDGNTHNLTSVGIASGAPSIGSPAFLQQHALAVTGLDIEAPTLAAPAFAVRHALTATGTDTEAPILGAPSIGQLHEIDALHLEAGTPTIGPAYFTQLQALVANDIDCGQPDLGAPALDYQTPPVPPSRRFRSANRDTAANSVVSDRRAVTMNGRRAA